MRQTIEDAAKEARVASAETLTTYGTHQSLDDFIGLSYDEIAESAFIKGAEWQAKQSPWVSVKERLPEVGTIVLTKGAYGFLICYLSTLGEWETGIKVNEERLGITHWCHIPDLGE